jgi:formate hydrogenlyase subunit 4
MDSASFLHPLIAVLFAPLMGGVINRTKAMFAGRKGPPLAQTYWDLAKLLRKGATYSRTTTWVFRAGPIVGLASALVAIFIVPFPGLRAPFSFSGDFLLLAYLLGLMRFFTVIAALDTGSSFEGLGASREVYFAALAEPALLIGLAVVARNTESLSLSSMIQSLGSGSYWKGGPAMALVGAALFVVFLSENARIPVDDPNTHLELTMIHEVMVLDHGGPDFAFVLYGSALKMWLLATLVVGIAVPVHFENPWAQAATGLGAMALLAVITGIVESSMSRLRLSRVPQLLLGAGALAVVALVLVPR